MDHLVVILFSEFDYVHDRFRQRLNFMHDYLLWQVVSDNTNYFKVTTTIIGPVFCDRVTWSLNGRK